MEGRKTEEDKQAKLIRQISESLSSYSIEAAHKEAGVTSPAKVQSPVKPEPPKKPGKKLPLKPASSKQLEIPKPVPPPKDQAWDSLSSDEDEPPAPKKQPEALEEDDEYEKFLKPLSNKKRKPSTGDPLLSAKKSESYPNLFD